MYIKIVFFNPKCLPLILLQFFDTDTNWGFNIGLLGVYLTIGLPYANNKTEESS